MRNGELIIIPTDTVYGLAAKLYDQKALEKIYQLKGRELSKQIPLLCHKISDLDHIAIVDENARKLMEFFWPGQITFVLSTKPEFYEKTHESTIACRIPNHPLALSIIKKYGVLRTTSLNKSEEPPLEDFSEIVYKFGTDVAEIYKQNIEPSRLSSTVVDLSKGEINILRQGTITIEDINRVIGKL